MAKEQTSLQPKKAPAEHPGSGHSYSQMHLTAGRPKRSQLLSTKAFQADSEAEEVGLLWIIARRMACWACSNANVNLVEVEHTSCHANL